MSRGGGEGRENRKDSYVKGTVYLTVFLKTCPQIHVTGDIFSRKKCVCVYVCVCVGGGGGGGDF